MKRMWHWLYSHKIDRYRQIGLFGNFLYYTADYPMRYGWCDFGHNYFDFGVGKYFQFIHGRGHYSIWTLWLLTTVVREPHWKFNVAWNPD